MKSVILGLVAATLMTTPAAATSWKVDLFDRLDADTVFKISRPYLRWYFFIAISTRSNLDLLY